ANTVLRAGDEVRGLALVEESVAQARQQKGDVAYLLNVLTQAGRSLLMVPGQEGRAAARAQEGLELAQRADRPYFEGYARFVLAHVAMRRGDLAGAQAQATTALQVERGQGLTVQVPHLLEELAIVAGREGRGERAARLLGAAAGLHETRGTPQEPALRLEIEATMLRVRAALDEAGWAAAFA